MLNLLLIGNGKFAKNYISTLSHFSNVKLTIANKDNWGKLIDNKPDGVMVCTPPSSHIEIASYSLYKDIPTMIEKPLALSSKRIELLSHYTSPILVNYSSIFTQAFEKIKDFVDPSKISKISANFFNDGPPRDYSSLWDYGPHALAVVLALKNGPPNIKIKKNNYGEGSQYYLKLLFEKAQADCIVGNIGDRTRSWSVSSDGMTILYDDTKRPDYVLPPLSNALNIFINAIQGKDDFRLGLGLSMRITDVLERCDQELANSNNLI